MKTSTFQKRTASFSKSSKGYQLAKQLLTTGEAVHPCWTSGTGRFCKNMDYTDDTVKVLTAAGLYEGFDFVVNNDAPKGGKTGNYIELTSKGLRKMIK